MSKRKTHEQFIKEFNEKNPNANHIEILGEYVKNSTPLPCKCKIDGYEWNCRPSHLLGSKSTKPTNCPMCSGKARKTTEYFKKEIKEINPNIEILGEYINSSTKILCKCKIDGHEWSPIPDNLLQKHGCPKCGGQLKKENEVFKKELENINPNIITLEEYNGTHNHILCKCNICNHSWKSRPHELLDGYGCPQCNSSKGEVKIINYLNKLNAKFISQYKFKDCKFKQQLPFDFYLPQHNICIEFDGKQHFEIIEHFGGLDYFIDRKIRDTIKNIYCQQNNIKLIRIPYWDFDNIEEILKRELNL